MTGFRIHLSVPHMSGGEQELVREAFDSNWIAPLGPQVDAFEREFAKCVQVEHATALSSGTAALHLALLLAGVGEGDDVLVSTLTFAASAFPVRYVGARPVFVDCERESWNIDPALIAEALEERVAKGRVPRAVVVVHLLGQCADMDPILAAAREHGVPVIEDAAEALGSSYRGRPPGGLGQTGIFSFNGNKIITTSGGGMLVSNDGALVARAKKLATQAREPAAHYEHAEVGYNYRMSNLLAGVGRAQLRVLEGRVEARRSVADRYREALESVPGVALQPEAPWGRHTRWLTCVTIDPGEFGSDRERVRVALAEAGIEARPIWKPMHRQPVFREAEAVGGGVADELFDKGLCLPSSSSLQAVEVEEICAIISRVHRTRGEHG